MRHRVIRRRVSAPGCDDAPIVTVMRSEQKRITLVYPYYENPRMLAKQIEHWSSMFRQAPCFQVTIVDDGSPTPAANADFGVMRYATALFRIEVDVRWNWLAARNLAMDNADGWCLLTDMDHVVPWETLQSLVWGAHDPNIIYRFSRVEADGTPVSPHPNSWFMTREMFWRIGGYDEALSGFYGTDGEYRRRAAATAPIRILTDRLVRHEFYLDASTTRYARKQPEDRAVQALVSSRGPDWKPRVLSFPWHSVDLHKSPSADSSTT